MITIRGITYDISTFNHPGGNVICQFIGKDATDMFIALHPPRSNAMKLLCTLPVLSVSKPIETAYIKLYDQVTRLVHTNYDARMQQWMIKDATIFAFLTIAWVRLLPYFWTSCVIYAIAMVHASWFMHNTIHKQFGNYNKHIIEFITGMSPDWWVKKHNVLHHAHTNVAELDTDIMSDLFAFEHKSLTPIMRYQHYTFWVLLAFLRILWCIQSLRTTKMCLLHHAGVIMLHNTITLTTLKWMFVGNLISGFIIGFIVVQSHNAEIIIHKQGIDHLAHTAITTRNLPFGFLHDMCSGYLNYQIEHHLFPWLPAVFLPDIQHLVKDAIRSQGLPYTQMTWTESTIKLHNHLYDIANQHKTLL